MFIKKIIISLLIIASFTSNITLLYCVSLFTCLYIIRLEQYKISIKSLRKIFFIFLINLVSLIAIDFNDKEMYAVFRDIIYLSLPILTIFIGVNFSRIVSSLTDFIKVLIFWGVIFASMHIYNYFSSNAIVESIYEVRSEVGNGNIITILALCFVIIFFKEFKLILSGKKIFYMPILIILSTSLFLSLSRTFIFTVVTCIVIVIIFNFREKIKSRDIVYMVIMIVLFVPSMILLVQFNDQINELFLKVANSFNEVKVSNYTTAYEINNNWRGYESYRALIKFEQGTIFQKIFGYGFGSEIDLGLEIKLGDTLMTHIPILHNGIVYLLVKSGLLGVSIYLIFLIYSICKSLYYFINYRYRISCVILLASITILFNSFTVTGIFNQGFSILLILYFYSQSLVESNKSPNEKIKTTNKVILKETIS